ncbi:HotDog domain-containing protein [Phycomyces nitens]|nr:HotDog domain-containing protein [Phycomyces nitens]
MPPNIKAFQAYMASIWAKVVYFVSQTLLRFILPDPYIEAGNIRVNEKPMYESRVTMTEIISPAHASLKGLAYAGTILGWIDIAAGLAAKRHSASPSVTRSVDDVAFLHPVKVGDIITIQASVNKSWNTSMEVGVKVEAESPLTGDRFFVAHAYLTFVALSPRPSPRTFLGRKLAEFHPTHVPAIIPMSDMEKKRFEMAETRRKARLERKLQSHAGIRELMHAWSQGRKEHADDDAPIIPHPILNQLHHHDNDDNEDNSEDIENHDLRSRALSAIKRVNRRFSSDPRMVQPKERRMERTFTEVVELVMPQHANTLSITFGGQIMAWMEICAIASANRLARAYLLTASIDSLTFLIPTRVGDVVTIRGIVSRSYNSSMEVYVSVESENLKTGERKFTNDGFFTIAAIDDAYVPVKVAKAIPQAEAEYALFEGSYERRAKRLAQRTELLQIINSKTPPRSPAAHPIDKTALESILSSVSI